jgi:hypothetical protein
MIALHMIASERVRPASPVLHLHDRKFEALIGSFRLGRRISMVCLN